MSRVLFVDDEQYVLNTLRRQLATEPYEMVFSNGGEEGLEALKNGPFGVIVSDMRMPGMDGVAFLAEAKRVCPDARRMILTGYADVGTAMAAINEAQVHAYHTKPWNEEDFRSSIRAELLAYSESLTQKDALGRIQEDATRLRHLADTDELTGLPNRRLFNIRMGEEWRRAARESTPLALAMIDIDYFKKINDSAGHLEGDRILQEIATALQHGLQRPADFVARYGGEEFAAILPNTEMPHSIGERLRGAVESLRISRNDCSEDGVVTVSVGVAHCRPAPGAPFAPELLIKAADDALYEAKQAGRNRVIARKPMEGGGEP